MTVRAERPHPIWILTVSTVLTLGTVLAPAAHAGTGYRAKLVRMVNATRERHNLRALRIDRSLSRDAVHHTHRMIRKDTIYDPPNLAAMLEDEPWTDVGASIVGCADTLRHLHLAFMHDAAHRDILLNRKLRRIGIGVIKVDTKNACGRHWFWATELFYG